MHTIDQIFLFALLGLGTGALIAGIGLGVVLSYRGSGVIDVATGAYAMVAGYLFLWLRTDLGGSPLGTAPAMVLALLATVALGVVVQLVRVPPAAQLVAAVEARRVPRSAPHRAGDGRAHHGRRRAHRAVRAPQRPGDDRRDPHPGDRFWLTGIVILAAAVLWALYRWSRFGLATRAASESEASAMLAGLSPDRLALTNAVLATTVAGGMGILAAAVTQIDTVVVPLQVVPALGAALFARFTSFSITCLVGLLIGMAQSLLYYAQTQSWFPTDGGVALPGVNAMLTFLVIVVALWWRGSTLPPGAS